MSARGTWSRERERARVGVAATNQGGREGGREGDGWRARPADRGWSDRVINIQSTPDRANNFLPSSTWLTRRASLRQRERRGNILHSWRKTAFPGESILPPTFSREGARQKGDKGKGKKKDAYCVQSETPSLRAPSKRAVVIIAY